MYIECMEGEGFLKKENLWYESNTSNIYKEDDLLYKIYTKEEPFRRQVLDILIANTSLRDIGVLPMQKIRTNLGNYGMVMQYIPKSITLRKYLESHQFSMDELMKLFIILSDNLKKIHAEDIHFSDLHHNNILISQNNIPLYIDFDDAVVKNYSSNHICCMVHSLHEVKSKGTAYKQELIRYGNLDMESLFVMFFNYILNAHIEYKNEKEFQIMVEGLSFYFPDELLIAVSALKNNSLDVIPYPYYIGDFLKNKNIRQSCKVLRRNVNGYNHF